MLELQDALRIVLDLASGRRVDTERVALLDALHRVLAEHVVSDIDMPPFPPGVRKQVRIPFAGLIRMWHMAELLAPESVKKRLGHITYCYE